MKMKDVTRGEAISIRVGDFVENSIEKQIIPFQKGGALSGRRTGNRIPGTGRHSRRDHRGRIGVPYLYKKRIRKKSLCVSFRGRGRLE